MVRRARHLAHVAAALAFLPVIAGVPIAQSQGDRDATVISVIVAHDSRTRTTSTRELRDVFRGERVASRDGGRYRPFNQPAGSTHRVRFDQVVFGWSAQEVGRYWVDRRIRGRGLPPRSVSSQRLLVRLVSRLRGAIAYVDRRYVDASVRELRVDGKSPGEPGYPFTFGGRGNR